MDCWWQYDAGRLQRELADHGGNQSSLARAYGVNRSTISVWVQRHAIADYNPLSPRPTDDRFVFQHMEEVTLTGDWMITSDWHLPLVDYDLVDRMVTDAKSLGIKKLIVAGDWFNFDALSDYMPKQPDADFPTELQDSNRLMQWLLDMFDEVVLTLANHDVRVTKQLGYKMRFDHSMRVCFYDVQPADMRRVTITNLDYVLIDTPEGIWRACHTNQYSKNQLSVPSQLADKYRMHVAAGHRHHHAIGHSVSGYKLLETGGLFDTSRTQYLKLWSNSFPVWQPGYAALIQGRVYCPMLSLNPTRIGL